MGLLVKTCANWFTHHSTGHVRKKKWNVCERGLCRVKVPDSICWVIYIITQTNDPGLIESTSERAHCFTSVVGFVKATVWVITFSTTKKRFIIVVIDFWPKLMFILSWIHVIVNVPSVWKVIFTAKSKTSHQLVNRVTVCTHAVFINLHVSRRRLPTLDT